jgi:putative MATE family efflux protein
METVSNPTGDNPYLTTPVPALFARTAFPIILIMVINGLFTVVDALLLGIFAGADALTAVTLTFPLTMLIFALTTMTGAGMASLLARALGAGDKQTAQEVFASAHALALLLAAGLALVFVLFGHSAISLAASHDPGLTEQGWRFLAIMIFFSPVTFVLSLQGDSLRSEGKAGLMAMLGVTATLLNIAFNYVLIAIYGFGPAGSATGTIIAQALTLAVVLGLRAKGGLPLKLSVPVVRDLPGFWRDITVLGLPSSLSFAGIAVSASIIIANVQIWGGDGYAETIAAYGIITRILSFAFLPLMGLNLASQSIAGNNYGAKAFARSDRTVLLALAACLVYAAAFEATLIAFPTAIGGLFVSDTKVISEIARILPVIITAYVLSAPTIILAGYFQALGMARIAGILSLTKPYLIQIPLAFAMPFLFGERGIWMASPTGDVLMLCVVILTLRNVGSRHGSRYGIFFSPREEAAV